MGKSSCFDEEETEPETFVSRIFFFPCGMQGFEYIFGEWRKLLTLIAIDCHEFLHVLIPIPLLEGQSECLVLLVF